MLCNALRQVPGSKITVIAASCPQPNAFTKQPEDYMARWKAGSTIARLSRVVRGWVSESGLLQHSTLSSKTWPFALVECTLRMPLTL